MNINISLSLSMYVCMYIYIYMYSGAILLGELPLADVARLAGHLGRLVDGGNIL